MRSILMLSGPVAAGKTTVAKALVGMLPEPVAHIEGDTFWSFLANRENQRTPKVFKVTMLSMMAAAVPYAVADFSAIVDFSIPPWFLDSARGIAKMRGVPLDYVVLRPSMAVCAARGASRAEGRIDDYTAYRGLYRDFDDVGKHVVSDGGNGADDANIAAIATRISNGLAAGTFRLT